MTCPCCSCRVAITVPFSPCIVCDTFVCERCRGEAIDAATREQGDRRAWVCRACERAYRGQAIRIEWNERGEYRLAAGPDKASRMPIVAASARSRCVSL